MGEHKHNPNCQLVKDGLLSSNPKKLGKRESERIIMREIEQKFGIDKLRMTMNGIKYYK